MDLYLIANKIARIKHKDKSDKFDWSEFKKLNTAEEVYEYANNHLEKLGEGSSRAVFMLTGRKVIKVAKPENEFGGKTQNKVEVKTSQDPLIGSICTKVYDSDDKYLWIVSEAARQIKSRHEFDSLSGMNFYTFMDILTRYDKGKDTINDMIRLIHKADAFLKKEPRVVNQEFLQSVLDLVDSGIDFVDLLNLEQWGRSADGKLVILDYGLE